jgi:hypothetical protein
LFAIAALAGVAGSLALNQAYFGDRLARMI